MIKLLLLCKKIWPLMLLSLLCSWLASLSSVALMGASAYLITSAALQPPLYTLSLAITTVRFCGISRAAFRYFERYLSHDASFRLLGSLRHFAYIEMEKNTPLPLKETGQSIFLNRLIEDIDILKDFYLRVFAPISNAILLTLLLCIVLSIYSLDAAIALFLCLLISLLLPFIVDSYQQKDIRQECTDYTKYKDLCIDAWLGLSDMQAASAEMSIVAELDSYAGNLTRQRGKTAELLYVNDQISALIINLALLVLLLLLFPAVHEGLLSGIILAMLLLSAQAVLEVHASLPEACRALLRAKNLAADFFKQAKKYPVSVQKPESQNIHPPMDSSLLMAREVKFSYEKNLPLLRNINFTIRAGEKVAIVGENGMGKSTLFHLILDLWEPSGGCLYWQGKAFSSFTPSEIRENIQAVTQNTYIFSTTLRNNFLKLFPDASDEEIIQALKKAQLADFLKTLPQGLDTFVGENGSLLSLGQRQRLGLARALLRPAKLLLLDEPTASLDAVTAHNLMQTLLEHQGDRAILLITHDWRLLRYMDRTIELKNGCLA